MRENSRWNRKKIIPLLLGIYVLLAAAACILLPERLPQEKAQRDATVSAPLALPDDLKERPSSDDAAQGSPGETP